MGTNIRIYMLTNPDLRITDLYEFTNRLRSYSIFSSTNCLVLSSRFFHHLSCQIKRRTKKGSKQKMRTAKSFRKC